MHQTWNGSKQTGLAYMHHTAKQAAATAQRVPGDLLLDSVSVGHIALQSPSMTHRQCQHRGPQIAALQRQRTFCSLIRVR